MPVRTARSVRFRSASRAAPRIGLAALFLIAGAKHTHNAVANGDTRTISLRHLHTQEELTVTFKRDGRYDDAALKKIDWLLRDWRRDEQIRMDPHLIDLVWEVHRDVGAKSAVQVVSAYRAPATNSMLRRRSSGVAQNSQHMLGKAIDFQIPDANLDDLRAAGLRLQRGGVGFYPTSGWPFVHMDVGSVRHWPRMTHDQLARVFPDGRTVHIPSDGKPLKNYALALADLEKRGAAPSATSVEAARVAGIAAPARSKIASLFGFGKRARDEDETPDVPSAAPPRPVAAPVAVARPAVTPVPVAAKPVQVADAVPTPMPRARPAPLQVAAVSPAANVQPTRPAQATSIYALAGQPGAMRPVTPNDVIRSRGYWQGLPEIPAETSAARRTEVASVDPRATGSLGPWTRETPRTRETPSVALAYASPTEPKDGGKSAGTGARVGAAGPAAQPGRPRAGRIQPVDAVEPMEPLEPMGSNPIPREVAVAAGTSVVLKDTPERSALVQSPQLTPAQAAALAGTNRLFDNPWLRATMATPSVAWFMNTTLWGAADYRTLQPLLQQPRATIEITFSADPNPGLAYDRFRGPAVVFVATANFARHTAALR